MQGAPIRKDTPGGFFFDIKEPASGSAATLTLAAAAGVSHVIHHLAWSVRSGTVLTVISILDNTNSVTLWKLDLKGEQEGFINFNDKPVFGPPGAEIIVSIGAWTSGDPILNTCYS